MVDQQRMSEPSPSLEPEQQVSSAPPAAEPRQSEEVRKLQSERDTARAEAEHTRRDAEELRQQNEQLQQGLTYAQVAAIPDERQRYMEASRQRQGEERRRIVQAEQRAAIAEVKLQHKDIDLSDSELQDAARIARDENDFKKRVGEMAERRRKDTKEKADLENRLREEIEVKVKKEIGSDRVSTSVPVAPLGGPDEEYSRRKEEGIRLSKPELVIAAARDREAARLRRGA